MVPKKDPTRFAAAAEDVRIIKTTSCVVWAVSLIDWEEIHLGAGQTRHFHNLQLLEHVDHMFITHPQAVATVVLGSHIEITIMD